MNLALPISLLFSSTGVTCHHNNNNNNNNKQHNTHIDAQYNSKQCKHQQPSTTPTYVCMYSTYQRMYVQYLSTYVCTVPINVCAYSTYQRMYVQYLSTYVRTVPINVCTYSTYQRMYVQYLSTYVRTVPINVCMYVCVYACTQHTLCHSWGSPPSV